LRRRQGAGGRRQQVASGNPVRAFGHAGGAFVRVAHVDHHRTGQLPDTGLLRGQLADAHGAIIGHGSGARRDSSRHRQGTNEKGGPAAAPA